MKKLVAISTILVLIYILFASAVFSKTVAPPLPVLSSEAAIVMEATTGQVLYEKNARSQMYPASVTKIATAIYAIESGNLNDVVTVSKKARNTEGTRVYLEEGEQVTLEKLLLGLLVNSGNDAGVAVAEHISGSVESFASDVNLYLKDVIGLQDTNFENPHGLFDPQHVTTAQDLAVLTRYATKNEEFMNMFGTKELPWNGEAWDTTLYTHHKLLREKPYDGVTGGKNGFVPEAGVTLVTTAGRENLDLIVVTLKSESEAEAYNDTVQLLDFGFDNFETSSIPTNSGFFAGELEYITPREIIYTHQAGEQVEIDVTEDGKLRITDQKGTLLSSYQFPVISDSAKNRSSIQKDSGSFLEQVFSNSLYLLVIGGSIVSLVYYRSRKKR
ncbi:D-alanyl-D-alanine carboxypeptidase family protein [Planococcus halotolerans]|uniref:D-alanyl-D-alanine carboxypeptidase n=1 Tax=Planococcus halotolerans TaxID=2233542 RepID=A0A365KQY7_9BACL|nr:D-alanyl-D-alanine carboxypeptidase family protein [Planococcus halotolerans]QHJ69419.1 D-alanyl-D-alanine carboxypeptidase [Planococcus halotolerans]RAZ75597.1 D-alanyl-D-alanine carboxypeptidase [Planococcus halotolerans]